MLMKWAVCGGIIGFVFGLIIGLGFGESVIAAMLGGWAGIGFRKWIFTTFWK